MKNTCCFTGHRPGGLPFKYNEQDPRCIALKNRLRFSITRLITEMGVDTFITGMAMGVDIFAAEEVLALKKTFKNVKLICAIPCECQADSWNALWKGRYDDILSAADESVVLSEEYTKACMHIRNRYMVDNSNYIIAVWNGKGSGTSSTIKYAEKKNREIIIINPEEL